MATQRQMRALYSLRAIPYEVSSKLTTREASALITEILGQRRDARLFRGTRPRRGSFWKAVGEGRGDYETDHYIGMEPF